MKDYMEVGYEARGNYGKAFVVGSPFRKVT